MVMNVVFVVLGLLWLAFAVRSFLTYFAMIYLPPRDPSAAVPRVSVVIAARDEGARLEQTVRRLFTQVGVELEIIVVDDRSRDDTPALLARLTAEEPRLQAVRVEELPPRWLGKCHACHVGAAQATGDWLLFTDGDIWMVDDTIARAVQLAHAHGAQHVCLAPGQATCTFWGRVAHLGFIGVFCEVMRRTNKDVPGEHCGIGAFNLIRTDVYRGFGGHEPLRLTVADDVKLSLLVRRADGKSRAVVADREVQAEWASSLPGVFKALEKNHFAATGYSIGKTACAGTVFYLLLGLTVAGPFTLTWAGWFAFAGLCSLGIPGTMAARQAGFPVLCGVLVPLGYVFLSLSMVNSTIRTLRQGGVRWRDTFYPLAMLREGNLR